MLKTRIRTVVVLNFIIIPLVIFSSVPYLMNSAVLVLSTLAMSELFRVTGNKDKPAEYIVAVLNIALCYVKIPGEKWVISITFLVALGFFFCVMIKNCTMKFDSVILCSIISLGFTVLYRSLVSLSKYEEGKYYLFMMIIVSIVTEMGGYFVGRKIGKHKLAPVVSPNKSYEGSIGGIVFSYILLNIIAIIAVLIFRFTVNWKLLEMYILPASIAGQFGDLAMSSIKRCRGVKDYGTILPGHGGILDRFDGQLFSAPFTCIFLLFVGEIITK